MSVLLLGFVVLLLLIIVVRMPIAFAMGLVGFFGYAMIMGLSWDNLDTFRWTAVMSMAAKRVADTVQNYSLSIIPLFILMGNLVTRSGLSHELYNASYAFLGHRKGGLAMATVAACGGFSAISGSSLATSATMSKVAMPPMRKFGYHDSLAAASIAAGGTLGILIPPSVILVIYGLLTETSIRELFAAGFIPGILGIFMYMLAVRYTIWRNPEAGPAGEKTSWPDRIKALKGVTGILSLFLLVMGGIYLGVFTPTEAAGIGAGGAFVIALMRKSLTWATLFETLAETARTTAMLFAVVIGALIFSDFVNRAGLPTYLLELITTLDVAPMLVILVIMAIYLLMGMLFESMSMLLLTIPIFFPVVQSLGFDPVWFGIAVVIAIEISLISPPVGMNIFVLSAVVRDVKTGTIFKGIVPFWTADILRLILIIFVAKISLFLPELLYR